MTKLSDDELNKRVHEIMGLCQHKWELFAYGSQIWYRCDCGDISSKIIEVYNFTGNWKTSAYEFGMMFEFMQKHERWEEFLSKYGWKSFSVDSLPDGKSFIKTSLISPRPFAEAMVRFFEEVEL